MKFVLANNYQHDTAAPGAAARFEREQPEICAGLRDIRRRLHAVPGLADRIRRKFAIKNTCGYSMNAFVDFEEPADILPRLLIGSEGTLGFISEITLNTLPDLPVKATALVYFRNVVDAGASIAPLASAGAAVLEIMDEAAMRSVAEEMKYAFDLVPNCAALLVEFQTDTEEALVPRLEAATAILQRYALLEPIAFTRDPAQQAHYWHMRKGLFPSVGAMREKGTAVLIEDVCVQPTRLADCIVDLQAMFRNHSFPDAIIFGHAKDGNIHFVICNDFTDAAQVARYAGLMDELTRVIVEKYDGSLKAEHGTGRNIAPFVELEWGPELYQLMWEVKRLLDPHGILNPGVILNTNPHAHLENLKAMPDVHEIVDKCIECGFCEPRCPSRDLTLTPRQRIVVLREMELLRADGGVRALQRLDTLEDQYEYSGVETCAGDSMCATACPVVIDTGAAMKHLRHRSQSKFSRRVAKQIAQNFGLIAGGARIGLRMANALGPFGRAVARFGSEIGHKLSGGQLARVSDLVPFPTAAPALPGTGLLAAPPIPTTTERQSVVYYPSCLTRILGPIPGDDEPVPLARAVVEVLQACGYDVIIPPGVGSTCCGQPFLSKGHFEADAVAAERAVDIIHAASDQGRIPVICETSPCSGHLRGLGKYLTGDAKTKWATLEILDFPTFLARRILPTRTDWPTTSEHVVLHPTCTLMKQGGTPDLRRVAETFAARVTIPVHAECCGFAGDKGFSNPELTLSATRPEADDVAEIKSQCAAAGTDVTFYSTCRTCEMGMTAATTDLYRSIVFLAHQALCGSKQSVKSKG